MKKLKRITALFISVLIVVMSLSGTFTLNASATIDLTDEQIKAKNYPLLKGYEVTDVYGTYDTPGERGITTGTLGRYEHSTEEGNYFDTGSLKITTANAAREMSVTSEAFTLTGDGFMFWYKSETRAEFRLRVNNGIFVYGNLDPCAEGRWVTYFYYGKWENITVNSSSPHRDLRSYVNDDTYSCKLNLYFGNAEEHSIYFDEFYSFGAIKTNADTYTSDDDFLKFSLAKRTKQTTTIDTYDGEGSTTLTSTYGSTTNKSPISIEYVLDKTASEAAIKKAKSGSGYLQVSVTDNNCVTTLDEDAYAKFTLTLNGTEKTVAKYIYGKDTTETYLLKVADLDESIELTSVKVAFTAPSAVKDVSFTVSPITVYYVDTSVQILQAEDLNGVNAQTRSSVQSPIATTTDTGENRTYINVPSKSGYQSYTEFTLPELEVGEYELGAQCYMTTSGGQFQVTTNNINMVSDVIIADKTYASYQRDYYQDLCKIKITKKYSDGATKLRFTTVPKKNQRMCIDYFTLKKTDTVVQTEPNSNFVIKDYPEMDRYEVKTILDNFDDYICSTDDRYYTLQQVYGYVGDGNAFNMNSRGTKKGNFDNNGIYGGTFDGDGIRFWYKSPAAATFQFKMSNGQIKYTKVLQANTGSWVTIYYTELCEDGDLSDIHSLNMKPNWDSFYYIDELHTIIEKVGDVTYELNGDGTASVVGFDLRLENVVINDTYKGCPVTIIKSGAIENSKTIKSVVIPEGVTTIESGAFKNCLNLSKVTLPNSLKTIGDEAFSGCEKLADIDIPEFVESISNTAFDGCVSITMNVKPSSYAKNYAFENGIKYRSTFGDYTYILENGEVLIEKYNGVNESFTIPESIDTKIVTVIGDSAFENNTNIKEIRLPNSIVKISANAFKDCVNLTNFTNSTSLTYIGENAFYNDSKLASIILFSVVTVGDNAFYNCSGIKNITLPETITSLGDNTFGNCDEIIVSVVRDSYAYTFANTHSLLQMPNTSSQFKYILLNYKATIVYYSGNSSAVEIPSIIDNYVVVCVAESAFEGKTSITSVVFPKENIKRVERKAFYNCENLSSLNIGCVTFIGAYAFSGCRLSKVDLTNLVDYATNSFDSDTKVNVEITQFARSALDYCKNITAGFNIGNTLEGYSGSKGYGTLTVEESERLWGAALIKKTDIKQIADSGINTIRLPITWYAFIDTNNGYKIDPAYMARIKEIVDWCYEYNLYVVINMHHDTRVRINMMSPANTMTDEIHSVWAQIADEFKAYDEKLIFEALNEPIAIAADGAQDWYSQDTAYMDTLNVLHKEFYNTVRNSGGMNNVRYLMLETYGAQFGGRQIGGLWLPSVAEDDHIIASVHMYNETLSEPTFTPNLERIYNSFIAKGIPCIIGESGLPCWDNYNDEYRVKWVDNFFGLCENYGIRIILWDDHGNYTLLNRSKSGTDEAWKYPMMMQEVAKLTKRTNPAEEVVYGDVNGDGDINSSDVLQLKKYLSGYEITILENNADVSKNGAVSIVDLLILKKYLVGIITNF